MRWKIISVLAIGFVVRVFGSNPSTITSALGRAYIPTGFDDNDKVQVTVAGTFPDTCYRTGPILAEMDETAKTVTLKHQAYHYEGFCLQLAVPYSMVTDLGILHAADYSVVDAATQKNLGHLKVSRATTTSPDDFLYAPVEDAYTREEDGTHYLYLKGNFPNRCMHVDQIQMHYYPDVIVVQAIARTDNPDRNSCGSTPVRFQQRVPIKAGVQGTFLLHVRVMNGQAINKLVEIP